MDVFDVVLFFFFKQKTAYEMRISDWSSDVCSSDLGGLPEGGRHVEKADDVRAQEGLSQAMADVRIRRQHGGGAGAPQLFLRLLIARARRDVQRGIEHLDRKSVV